MVKLAINSVNGLFLFYFSVCLFLTPIKAGSEDRKPFFAGKFYPEKKEELVRTVDKAISLAAINISSGTIIAIIAPHAGYEFSASVAGYAYKAVFGGKYDTVVILGTGHTMAVDGAAVFPEGSFETPLGRVTVDQALARKLLKENDFFSENYRAHAREHSIEVQLPFLQRALSPGFKILPIVINTNSFHSMRRAGEILGGALKGKKALIVMSSDLSHYPSHKIARLVDKTTLLALETLEPEYFWLTNRILLSRGEKNLGTAWCGEAAVIVGLSAVKTLGANLAVELKYADSSEENRQYGNTESVVGYASVVFVKNANAAPFKPEFSREQKHLLLMLAREAVSSKFNGKPLMTGLSDDYLLNLPGAVFVTITKKGVLRGCVGTIQPRSTIRDAVIYSAYSAAFEDSRFSPVTREELPDLKFEISLLSPLKKVKDAAEIRPGKHGVVIVKDGKSGLFLPQVWEQIPGKDDFLSEICSQKAGLEKNCWKDKGAELYIFTVDAFQEE